VDNIGAHNFFLIVLSDTGLVGMTLIAAFIFAWAKEILKSSEQGMKILLLFAAYWLPIATSGHWELAPYSWFIVGLTSRIAAIDSRKRANTYDTEVNLNISSRLTHNAGKVKLIV
jgi:O-antigen ligase